MIDDLDMWFSSSKKGIRKSKDVLILVYYKVYKVILMFFVLRVVSLMYLNVVEYKMEKILRV